MADKQIIIDGVPVQDCCYFDYENDGYEDSCYIHQNECSAQNCYYKQLKRKEQECEELKNEYWKLEQGNDFLAEKNSKLKGCLSEIKEIAEDESYIGFWDEQISQILQKISEVEECKP